MPARVEGRPMPAGRVIDLRHEKRLHGRAERNAAAGDAPGARGRRPGDPAAQPPGLSHVRRLPEVRPRGQVPRLRRGRDVPQRPAHPDLPHLRRRATMPARLSGVLPRRTCTTAASAPSGWNARSRRRFPNHVCAADGLRHDAASPAATRRCWRRSRRARCRSCWARR